MNKYIKSFLSNANASNRRYIILILCTILVCSIALIYDNLWSSCVFHRNVKVNSLVWSPEGDLLASSYNDGAIYLLNYDKEGRISARCIQSPHTKRDKRVLRTCRPKWSADGKFLAAYSGSDIVIWDTRKEAPAKPVLFIPQSDGNPLPDEFAWSSSGKQLAVFNTLKMEIFVYEPNLIIEESQALRQTHKIPLDNKMDIIKGREVTDSLGLFDICWSPDGTSIFIPGYNQIYNLRLSDNIANLWLDETESSKPIWSPNGKRFVLMGSQFTINSEYGNSITIGTLLPEQGPVIDMVLESSLRNDWRNSLTPPPRITWSPDSQKFAYTFVSTAPYGFSWQYAYRQKHISIWDSASGKKIYEEHTSNRDSKMANSMVPPFYMIVTADIALNPRQNIIAEATMYYCPLFEFPMSGSYVRLKPAPKEWNSTVPTTDTERVP